VEVTGRTDEGVEVTGRTDEGKDIQMLDTGPHEFGNGAPNDTSFALTC
jgi:hypothetical protein